MLSCNNEKVPLRNVNAERDLISSDPWARFWVGCTKIDEVEGHTQTWSISLQTVTRIYPNKSLVLMEQQQGVIEMEKEEKAHFELKYRSVVAIVTLQSAEMHRIIFTVSEINSSKIMKIS